MKILAVYAKDYHVNFEMSLEQILKLLDFLDKCEFQGDTNDEKYRLAKEYVTQEFFPQLDELADEIVKK